MGKSTKSKVDYGVGGDNSFESLEWTISSHRGVRNKEMTMLTYFRFFHVVKWVRGFVYLSAMKGDPTRSSIQFHAFDRHMSIGYTEKWESGKKPFHVLLFSNGTDDGDKMRKCWRSMLHIDGDLPLKKSALMDGFSAKKAIRDYAFRR